MTRSPALSTSLPRAGLVAALALLLAACGADESPTAAVNANPADPFSGSPVGVAQVPGSTQQVETRIGETTVYAVAMPTTSVPVEVAREHGIERREDLVMLRVSGRRGEVGNLTSVPLKVQATATDLRGQVTTLTMEERPTAGLVDYVGAVDADLPDTLRFDIRVTTPDGASETMQLTREVSAAPGPAGQP
ncbi:DUF4426 domain-containing protein [Cognatilysobacter bugurensis]|nr:DUF4426 domain-containing protein [Lysobacter bugurensis]